MTFDEWLDEIEAEEEIIKDSISFRDFARSCWRAGYTQCLKDYDIDEPLPPAFCS